MKKSEYNKNISDKFGNERPPIDGDELWAEIEPHLKKKKKKRRIIFWIFLGFGAIASLFTWSDKMSFNEKDDTSSVNNKTEVIAKQQNLNLQDEQPIIEEQNAQTNTDHNLNEEDQVDQNSTNVSVDEGMNETKVALDYQKVSQESKSKVSGRNTTVDEKRKSNIPVSIVEQGITDQEFNEIKEEALPMSGALSILNKTEEVREEVVVEEEMAVEEQLNEEVISEREEVSKSEFVGDELVEQKESLVGEEVAIVAGNEDDGVKVDKGKIDREQEKKDRERERRKKSKSKAWVPFVEASLSGVYAPTVILTDDAAYQDFRKSAVKPIESYGSDISLLMKHKSGLLVSTGIQFFALNERIRVKSITEETSIQTVDVAVIENAAGEIISTERAEVPVTVTTEIDQRLYNSQLMFNLPIGIGYGTEGRNMKFQVMVGADMNFYSKLNGAYLKEDLTFSNSEEGEGMFHNVFFGDGQMGLWTTMSVTKKVGKRMDVILKPRYRFPLQNLEGNKGPYEQKIHQLGLGLGILYRLTPEPKGRDRRR